MISLCFSVAGLAAILLVWIAGSHQYGMYSRVWQAIGIPQLVFISALAYGVSALILRRRPAGSGIIRLIPVIALAGSLIPFAAFLLVLMARYYYAAG